LWRHFAGEVRPLLCLRRKTCSMTGLAVSRVLNS
jgi:hypothetical protein